MLGRWGLALLALLVLSGCGQGSEDFTVRIARPPERVMQALGHAGLDADLGGYFTGLKVDRSMPSKDTVLYTIPGDARFPAGVLLTFEAVDGGKGTVVHAAIDVPAVKVTFKGKTKVISETKVEFAIRDLIQKVGSKLEEGGDTVTERKELSKILTVLAVVTDSKQLRRAVDLEKGPNWAMGGEGGLYDGDVEEAAVAHAYGNAPTGEDPAVAIRRQEYRDQERAAHASAPMDSAAGEAPRGTDPHGSGSYPDE